MALLNSRIKCCLSLLVEYLIISALSPHVSAAFSSFQLIDGVGIVNGFIVCWCCSYLVSWLGSSLQMLRGIVGLPWVLGRFFRTSSSVENIPLTCHASRGRKCGRLEGSEWAHGTRRILEAQACSDDLCFTVTFCLAAGVTGGQKAEKEGQTGMGRVWYDRHASGEGSSVGLWDVARKATGKRDKVLKQTSPSEVTAAWQRKFLEEMPVSWRGNKMLPVPSQTAKP